MYMNIIVTGGTGLIGRPLIEKLINRKYNVASVVHVNANNCLYKDMNYVQYVCDLSNAKKLSLDFLPHKADAVIHLVQSNKYKDFPNSADDIFYTNVNSTFCMLEYARKHGVKTFILASSGGIYGFGENPFSEADAQICSKDLGFYLSTKMCAEALAENYKEYMNVIILRFFFVYGPNSKNTMLLPRLVTSISNQKPISLQGEKGININPIYVDDAINAIVESLNLDTSCCINVAGKEVITLRNLSELIGKKLNKKPIFEIEKSQPKHLIADISKMKELIGESKTSLDVGIERLIVSMRSRGLL